jgi:hypothetical protein
LTNLLTPHLIAEHEVDPVSEVVPAAQAWQDEPIDGEKWLAAHLSHWPVHLSVAELNDSESAESS